MNCCSGVSGVAEDVFVVAGSEQQNTQHHLRYHHKCRSRYTVAGITSTWLKNDKNGRLYMTVSKSLQYVRVKAPGELLLTLVAPSSLCAFLLSS